MQKNFMKIILVRIAMLFLSLSTIDAAQEKVEYALTSSTKNKWMDEAIEGEFIKFKKSGISQKRVDATYEAFTKECTDGLNRCRGLVKRYKVINQKVYGEETTVKYLLELMCERYSVPDVDFLYYYQDEIATNNPIIKKSLKKPLSWCPLKRRALLRSFYLLTGCMILQTKLMGGMRPSILSTIM